MACPFCALGLPHLATEPEINHQYRLRALHAHPDKKGSNLEMYGLDSMKRIALLYTERGEMPNRVCSAGAAPAPLQAPPPTPAGPGTSSPPPRLMQPGTHYIEEWLVMQNWRMWLRCIDCSVTGGSFDGKGSDPYDAAKAQGWTKAMTKTWNNSPCCKSCSQKRERAVVV